MHENLYEYAVIHVVPRVEREEFMNVGIILFCKNQKFLQTKFVLNEARLHAFSCKIDVEELQENLETWEKICAGGKAGGTIGLLPMASRFRWLTATRSTILQTSKVHSGRCLDAEETLNRLFEALVL